MAAEIDTSPTGRPSAQAADGGFTIVEVLIAILLLMVGVLGLVGAFDSARKLNLLSERRTSMAHRAQLEIERLQAIPYAELGMHEPLTYSSEPSNPDHYFNSSPTKCVSVGYGCYEWNAENTTEAEEEPLVKEGAIYALPSGRECSEKFGACEWKDGLVSGSVYDFITWHTDKNCKTANDYKRITVVVTAKVPSGNHEPAAVRVSTLITPKEVPSSC
jgi:Tfp pilus assembly protein PilV